MRRVVEALAAAGLDYMVTGSTVSSLQGEPRATHDIDIVIEMNPVTAYRLSKLFPEPEFYLDELAAREAAEHGGMFNLLHVETGDKIDFWVLTDDAFDRSRFARRCEQQAGDLRFSASRPEDTILMKLKWARMSGGSEKQYTDALRVYEVQAGRLDAEYLQRWGAALGVSDLLERILRDAEPLQGS